MAGRKFAVALGAFMMIGMAGGLMTARADGELPPLPATCEVDADCAVGMPDHGVCKLILPDSTQCVGVEAFYYVCATCEPGLRKCDRLLGPCGCANAK